MTDEQLIGNLTATACWVGQQSQISWTGFPLIAKDCRDAAARLEELLVERDAALDQCAELHREVKHWREARQNALAGGEMLMKERDAAVARAQAAEQEVESLRAECGLRQIAGYNKGKAEANNDALRYQWARKYDVLMWNRGGDRRAPFPCATGKALDAAIDAAMLPKLSPTTVQQMTRMILPGESIEVGGEGKE